MWSGMEQSFFMADYYCVYSSQCQAYVSCAWGICYIGYVTVCFGVTDVISSSLTGPLGKALGRVPMMSFAAALQVASIVTLLYWRPSIHDKAILFVMSGLWGITDGVLSVQSNGKLTVGMETAHALDRRLCASNREKEECVHFREEKQKSRKGENNITSQAFLNSCFIPSLYGIFFFLGKKKALTTIFLCGTPQDSSERYRKKFKDLSTTGSAVNYSSPMASLVLTDSSQLNSDSQHLVHCESDALDHATTTEGGKLLTFE
ncbi:unnamed protein product [Timema podura]|uniref:Uncharacterized protein n=1 Tax=Timema podura TaxID=61482 RepID=A0ABN7NS91_TIMPD|nr:unnamed protein product [Timema podura]